MKSLSFIILIIITFSTIGFCQVQCENYLYRCNEKLVEVVMEDVFTPPVGSRVNVYPNIAAYEVLCKKNLKLTSFCKQLNGLDSISSPSAKIDFELASCIAFTTVAKKLVYSEYIITDFENTEYTAWLTTHHNDSMLMNASIDYGKKTAQQIIAWLLKDNYNYTRTLSRYVLSDTAGAWQPTGPDYANALEPNWPLMRSFVFDSNTVVRAIPNVTYSEKKNSLYYKNAKFLYDESVKIDSLKKSTANYWDDNPNVLKSGGHLSYFIHKVSPGGHWIKITGQAVKNLQLDEYKTAQVYAYVTLAIYEGFLNCWTEKYISNALRPETYINRLIAPKWKSYIETPPFPEYTSGHSVISSAAATILTALIPQPYAFTDSSEMYIGIPPRYFNSFRDASNEASVSRFYGGIHYMPSLNNGIVQGKAVGDFILKKLNTVIK